MSHDPEGTRWPHVPYARLPELSDARLAEYAGYWRARMEAYRFARSLLPCDHPDAYRTGYSAWWCSKYLSSALVEQERRAAGVNGSGWSVPAATVVPGARTDLDGGRPWQTSRST